MRVRVSEEDKNAARAAIKSANVCPQINPLDYKISLIRYLNWHSNTDSKVIKNWALDYLQKHHPDKVDVLSKASEYDLRMIGLIGYALNRGEPIDQKDIEKLNQNVEELYKRLQKVNAIPVEKSNQEQKYIKSKAQNAEVNESNALEVIGDINGVIDDFLNGKDLPDSISGILRKHNATPACAKQVAEFFSNSLQEIKQVLEGKDEQLKEGYSNFSKPKLKKFYAFLQQIMLDTQQQIISAKAQRKPRKRKEKPASVIAKNVKYKRHDEELKLTSEAPEKIVGASEVWLYDTQYRNLICAQAEKGQNLSIRGTTIVGISVANSLKKKIRKPEEFFKDLSLTKINLKRGFESLKTKAQTYTGRINENMIILKVI